ncbi:hypothetical protein L1987_80093 [Smallanthus sonchifolius]|uniref:Uncharacterized protein n=1 Tax=Smallanthus sonchifolius TaxID=185202 RepID=A0ACB8YLM7_9ASTR|nr:hypothetical protein L1987_80093 [Smallanthus sonchifolius]
MAHTYGPIFKLKLGSKLHVVINTPELAKAVVRDHDEAFSNRDQSAVALAITYDGQDIVFANNNHNWRKLRKLFVHEVLSNKNLEASGCFRRDDVRKAIKNVFDKIGTAINICEIAFATETNVLPRTIWENTSDEGMKHRNLAVEIDDVAANIVKNFGRVNLSDFFPSLARFDLQGVERDMKMQRDKMDKLFTSIIEDRIESNLKRSQDEVGYEGKKDFVQILLDHKDEKDETSLSMTQMKAVLLDVMIAGTETMATAVEWAMACIMRDHNVMKNVQEELVEIVGVNNIVEESHLPKLKYLDAIIKETLRLPLAEKMLMLILSSLLHSFDWSLPESEEHDLTEIFSIALKKRKPLIAIPSQRYNRLLFLIMEYFLCSKRYS